MRSSVIIPIFILLSLNGFCQSISGTWLGAYQRDNTGDRRVFYYRFYLQQKEDSVFGICEALNALSDVKGISPDESTATASYKVYNNNFVAAPDSSRFSLTVGEQINASSYSGQTSQPPTFLNFECIIDKQQDGLVQNKAMIMYSLQPVADEPLGRISVKKISDTIPEWINLGDRECDLDIFDIIEKGINSLFRKKVPTPKTESPILVEDDILEAMRQREHVLQGVIETDSEIAIVYLYDNGVIDDDIVSVFLNDQLLISNKKLSAAPIHLEVKLEPNKENKFTLFAHNEGKIPPNTALLLVRAGSAKHSILLKSTLQQNSVVVLNRSR